MKLKEKLNQAAGFTLVELIVVIAILAILAGVAVPVYSGYIEKANEAADQQLLAAVNRAFAAACAEAGVNPNTLTGADMPIVDGKIDMENVKPAGKVNEAFATYFAGNENSEFKVYEKLYYNATLGMFQLNNVGMYNYGGGQIQITAEQAYKWGLSTYGSMEISDVMGKIDTLSDFMIAADFPLDSMEYWQTVANALGVSLNDDGGNPLSQEDLQEAVIAKTRELAEAETDDPDEQELLQAKILMNANVLYTSNLTLKDTDKAKEVVSTLGTAESFNAMYAEAKENPAEFASQLALAYAMYTSYGNRYPDKAATDPAEILVELKKDNADFKAYVNSADGQADMEGYLAALGMVNSSMSDADAVESLVTNGFTDTELIAALQAALGG